MTASEMLSEYFFACRLKYCSSSERDCYYSGEGICGGGGGGCGGGGDGPLQEGRNGEHNKSSRAPI